MTTTTDTDVVPVGTRVRIINSLMASSVGVEGVLTVDEGGDSCCGGAHRYVIETATGRTHSAGAVIALDSDRPFQVGDRVEVRSQYRDRYNSSFDRTEGRMLGTVAEIPLGRDPYESIYGDEAIPVKLDGKSNGAYGNGIYAVAKSHLALVEPTPEEAIEASFDGSPGVVSTDGIDWKARAEAAENALQAFKDKVHEVASSEAIERDWCSEIDEVMRRLGLPEVDRGFRDMDITVSVELTTTVTLTREMPKDADASNYIDSYDVRSALRDAGFDLDEVSVSDWNIEEVNEV